MLLSALVERSGVSCMLDFSIVNPRHPTSTTHPTPNYPTPPYFGTAFTWSAYGGLIFVSGGDARQRVILLYIIITWAILFQSPFNLRKLYKEMLLSAFARPPPPFVSDGQHSPDTFSPLSAFV